MNVTGNNPEDFSNLWFVVIEIYSKNHAQAKKLKKNKEIGQCLWHLCIYVSM